MALHLFFYQLFLHLYRAGISVAAFKNSKAKLWLQGRHNWQQRLQHQVQQHCTPGNQTIWMHCASLGEFEQGRPLLEKLAAQYPSANIIVSFFSPSGYEVCKNYKVADLVCYLPMDSAANAQAFIEILRPTLVLWVKYEFWYYFLTQIKRQNIPLMLVSGIFRPGQPFFKWYGRLYRSMLQCFTHLFVQNEASRKLAGTIVDTKKITVSGDTRFDRVIAVAENFEPVQVVADWIADTKQIMVCGSTWDEDEEELSHYVKLHPEIKFIIAPHHVNREEITDVLTLFPEAVLYSKAAEQVSQNHVLIIDTIGILSRLYHYATVAYVGGGFGSDGVHNVLEAAVYGKPVVHGPEYEKFAEAKELVETGGSFETTDALQLEKLLDKLFTDTTLYNKAAAIAKSYVYTHKGASNKIVHFIQENRLLTR